MNPGRRERRGRDNDRAGFGRNAVRVITFLFALVLVVNGVVRMVS